MSGKDVFSVLLGFTLLWIAVSVPILSSPLGHYPVIDASWHYLWADEAASGNTFVYAPYFRAPLYPLILSLVFRLTGSSITAGAILSYLFSLFTVHLVQRMVYASAGRRASILAACAVGLNGAFLFYSSSLLITPMYVFLLILSFFLFQKEKPSPLGWFVLGLAVVTRPSAILLLPVSFILYRQLWRSSWLFLLPVVFIWTVNWTQGDAGNIVSSQGGINLYIGSGPEADGYTSFAPAAEGRWAPEDDLPYVDNVWAAGNAVFNGDFSPSEISRLWIHRTLEYVWSEPGNSTKLLLRKLLYLVSPVAIPSNYDIYYYTSYSPLLVPLAGSPGIPVSGLILWFLLPGALAAGSFDKREKGPFLWAAVLACGVLPFFVTARFVLPVMPFMVILLAPRFMRQPGKSLVLAPLGVLAGLSLALLTSSTVRSGGVNMAFHDGVAHCQQDLVERGEYLLLMAVEVAMDREDGIDLNGTDALYNLGIIAFRRLDFQSAEEYWRMALERDPGNIQAGEALQGLTGQSL